MNQIDKIEWLDDDEKSRKRYMDGIRQIKHLRAIAAGAFLNVGRNAVCMDLILLKFKGKKTCKK